MSVFDGVMVGSECADFWEKRNKEYHAELEQYVLENPGLFGVFVATGRATAADFSMVMWVDLVRLGEGFARGGVKGVVQDLFRVMNFIPQGKVLQGVKAPFSKLVQRIANIRIWRKCEGQLCVPISLAQALQRSGYKIGVGLSEIADALGVPLKTLFKDGLAYWSSVEPALARLGLKTTKLMSSNGSLSTFNELKAVAGQLDGPILLRITSDAGGHAILVGKTLTGVKIIDRAGIFSSLDDLALRYGVPAWTIDTARPMFAIANAVIDERLLKLANSSNVLAVLVRHSFAVFDIRVSRAEIEADFEKFLQRKGVLDQDLTTNPPNFRIVPGGPLPPVEYLTGVRERLKRLGYYSGPINGAFDPITKNAVISFQRANPPLKVDGIPGPKTQARLKVVYGS